MSFPARFALLLACCAALAAGAYHAAARALDAVPLLALARAAALGERLDRANACCQARLRFKTGLAEDLARGRLTLPDAIARLRGYLDGEPPPGGPEARWSGRAVLRTVPGDTEDERCGRDLIREAGARLRGSPGLAGDVVARLEGELQEHLARVAPARMK